MRWSVLVFFAWTENRKWGTDEPQRHDCSPQDSAAGLGCKGGGPAERAVGPDHRSEPRGGPATGNHPLRSRQRLPRSGLTDPIYRKGRRDRGALFLLSQGKPPEGRHVRPQSGILSRLRGRGTTRQRGGGGGRLHNPSAPSSGLGSVIRGLDPRTQPDPPHTRRPQSAPSPVRSTGEVPRSGGGGGRLRRI